MGAADGVRARPAPQLVTAGVLLVVAVVLFALTLVFPAVPPALNWLPAIASSAVAALANFRASRTPGMPAGAARMWRHLSVSSVLIAGALTGDLRKALTDPEFDGLRHDLPTTVLYNLSFVVILVMLFRLPRRRGTVSRAARTARFALDTATITVTAGVFAWYLMGRSYGSMADAGPHRLILVLLGVLVLCLALAIMSVALSATEGIDRGVVRILVLSIVVGGAGSSLLPALFDLRGGLTSSHVMVSASMVITVLAADRQRRIAGTTAPDRVVRRHSLIPYLAVAATDGLLVYTAVQAGGLVPVVAAGAVVLTGLVVVRQVHALFENDRLLRRVDAGQAQLAHRATHDDLTGLANRALLEQATRERLERPGPDGFGLVLIDLDDFKEVNDRLGHAVGDALLTAVGDRLRTCVRDGDLVARLGGDEFGLLLDGVRGDEAGDLMERITESLRRPVHARGFDLLVTASAGLSCSTQTGAREPHTGTQELLRRADLAMYAAKAAGKGRYAVYNAELEKREAADAELAAALRRALDRSEFSLAYQPIVQLTDGRWTGVEALVRWERPGHGFVGPATFVPIAERTGLIVPLGDWILRTALRQAADWDRVHGDAAPGEINVNVSARQLREPGFAGDVRAALTETGFDAERVVIEVTETAVFDGGVALDTLQDLVGLGVRVALDDFGTGHSSLGLLRTCPVDVLKLDKSFVDGVGGPSEEAVIATAMIQIANGLHLHAVAEGVETAEQAATLLTLGYRWAQGYHFARPMTAEQVSESLGTGDRMPV